MSIIVNFVEGSRKSACKNDAWSVIDTRGGAANVIDFISVAELGGRNHGEIVSAFGRAALETAAPDELCRQARRILGLPGPSL